MPGSVAARKYQSQRAGLRSPARRIVRGVSVKMSTPRRSPTGTILRDAAGNTIKDEVPAHVNGVLTNMPVGPYGTFSVPLNAFANASNLGVRFDLPLARQRPGQPGNVVGLASRRLRLSIRRAAGAGALRTDMEDCR